MQGGKQSINGVIIEWDNKIPMWKCTVCGNINVPLEKYSIGKEICQFDQLCYYCANWLNNIFLEYHIDIGGFKKNNARI